MDDRHYWVASVNMSKHNPKLVQPDVIRCWREDCDELALATYVDQNMLGHKFCALHLHQYFNHLRDGSDYCIHRIPHSWFLWDFPNGCEPEDIGLPFCLPVGKCTYYPRSIDNYVEHAEIPKKAMAQIDWNHDNKVYWNCGCNGKGYTIEGYKCCYADTTSPEREARRETMKLKFRAKFKQLSLLGGNDE